MKKSFIEKVSNEGWVYTRKYYYYSELLPAGYEGIYRKPLDAYGNISGSAERVALYNPNTDEWKAE